MPPPRASTLIYMGLMSQLAVLAATLLFVATNFYIWSFKQDQVWLFWESLGGAAFAFSAMFFYVTRPAK